ncbi:MAG: DUF4296 domain-containing protein [Chitinophagales bacterium]|nr:DUF4296 domain-containing protein [Chitinophagales bacterium]
MNYFLKIYKYSLLIGAIYALCQCKNKNSIPPPPDLIEEKIMGRIIADALLIENKLSVSGVTQYNLLLLNSYPLLDQKYHLKDSQSYYSYQYYVQQPEKFKQILQIAIDTLNTLKEKLPKENTDNQ